MKKLVKLNNSTKLAMIGAATACSNKILNELKPMISTFIKSNLSYNIEIKQYREHIIFERLSKELFKRNPNLHRFHKYNSGLDTTPKNALLPDGNYIFIYNKSIHNVNIENPNESDNTKINISISGINAKENYESLIEKLYPKHDNTKIYVTLLKEEFTRQFTKYSMDNIFTKHKNDIIKILDNFKKDKYFYDKYQIIHKIGILLDGEPGTGKTSMAKAIASYMGYRLISVKANELTNDVIKKLRKYNNTVILLEDIDCTVGKRCDDDCKEEDDNAYSSINNMIAYNNIGKLLDLLDGIASPNNVIFVGTTNHKTKLDPALLRNSRFDYQFELGKIDKSIAEDMCNHFNTSLDIIHPMKDDEEINPSLLQFEILEYLKNQLN